MCAGRRLDIIASAVDELPARYREAFLLQVVCGWTFEAVSREIGISERMAKVYVARALMHIQHRLDAEFPVGVGGRRLPISSVLHTAHEGRGCGVGQRGGATIEIRTGPRKSRSTMP